MRVIGYITSGYPSMQGFADAVRAFVAGGCDMLEISIPLANNHEAPYLSDLMKASIAKYPDYHQHLESIRAIAKTYPDIPITLLLYDEVVVTIGAAKIADLCIDCGIKDINSPDLNNIEALRIFSQAGIDIAGLITFTHNEKLLEQAKQTNGFIYCQAFPREGQEMRPNCDTPEKLIAYIRGEGIQNPIYCGGGIRTPEDALRLKKAGADGFFLGTSILSAIEDSNQVIETIRAFRDAVTTNK